MLLKNQCTYELTISIFWDITPCNPLKVTDVSDEHASVEK
jgi:hypothetical protein